MSTTSTTIWVCQQCCASLGGHDRELAVAPDEVSQCAKCFEPLTPQRSFGVTLYSVVNYICEWCEEVHA